MKYIITILLFFMGFLNIFSQRAVESGGRTRKQTKCKPIRSTELKSLSLDCYISSQAYQGIFNGHYSIKVTPTEDGMFTFACNKQSVTVSADALKPIQDIIKKYKLESRNGLYNVVAGLPVEHQPMYFTAVYQSDEKLSFTENNNPHSDWTLALFNHLRNVLIANGDSTYAIPDELRNIDRLIVEYMDTDSIKYSYGNIIKENNDVQLYRYVFDKKNNKSVSEDYAPIPEGHYAGLTDVVEKLGLQWLVDKNVHLVSNTKELPTCRIYANDPDMHPLFELEYKGDEVTDDVKKIINTLREYMDKPLIRK